MGKNENLKRFVNLLSHALAHRIGSIVNSNSIFAPKYVKEAMEFMRNAAEAKMEENWNEYDKVEIKIKLKEQLISKLQAKLFLDDSKFDIVDSEIENALLELGLN